MSRIIDLGSFLSSFPSPHHIIVLDQPLYHIPNFIVLFNTAILKICADGGTNRLHSFDPTLIPDMILGDLDSVDAVLLNKYQSLGTRVEGSGCQETTDLEKCINKLDSLKHNDIPIVVVGVTGGRLDHMMSNINAAFKSLNNIILIGDGNISCRLDPNVDYTLNASIFLTPMCGIIPFGSNVKCTSTGFKWDMNELELSLGGMIGSCNRFDSERVNVKIAGGPCLWTCEPKLS